jgi:hypothetical protein
VAYAYNPSYSGGRSGGSQFEASPGFKPYLKKKKKKTSQKRTGGVAQGIGPEFK